jgi:hypothetical protein
MADDWYIYIETDGDSFHLPILVLLFFSLFKFYSSPADFTIQRTLQSFFLGPPALLEYHDFRSI